MKIFLSIPKKGRILVKAGQKIDYNTKLFEVKNRKVVKIDLRKELGISPQNIFSYLKKFIGDKVTKGDILASKKRLLLTKTVKSQYDGVLKDIDHEQGLLLIETEADDDKKQTFFSPVIGEVQTIEKEGVKIKIEKKEEIEVKEETKEMFGARVFILENEGEIKFESVVNRLIVTQEINSILQTKLEALGAKGFLTIKKLPQSTTLQAFQFKNLDEIKKVRKNWSCFIDKNSTKMIFYE